MEELFNFDITLQSGCFSDTDAGRFIETCLDPHKLFWGGGYHDSKIHGNVVGDISPLLLNQIIENFIAFFNDAFFYFEIFEMWEQYISVNLLDRDNLVIRFVPLG